MDKYISVSELSRLLDVSTQYIYKQLKRLQQNDNDLYNQVAKVTNGKKRVNAKRFADYIGKELQTDYQLNDQPIDNGCKQDTNQAEEVARLKAEINRLEKDIDYLREQNMELIRLIDQEQKLKLASDIKLLEKTDLQTDTQAQEKTKEVETPRKRRFFNLFK